MLTTYVTNRWFIDKVEATKDDIVIMSKGIEIKDFMYLKDKGIKFIFDICDNKWRLGKDRQKIQK